MDSPEPPARPQQLPAAAELGADRAAANGPTALALPAEAIAECEAALRDAAGASVDWVLAHERGGRALPVISWGA